MSRPNPKFPYPRAFANLPPELGITSCCKEVFWVNNNAPYCVADASLAPSTSSGPSSTPLLRSAPVSCAVEDTQSRAINSTIDGLRKIARNEGITTLWRGLSPTLLMAVPGNVIYFAGYDWLRTSPLSPISAPRIPDHYAPLVAGSSARIMAAIVVSPMELFRTRMQAAHSSSAASNFRDTYDGVKDMVAAQGVRSLWRGLTLTLWRDVPFSALYWWGYEAGKKTLGDARDSYERGRNPFSDFNPIPTSPAESRTRVRSSSRERQRDHTATLVDSFIAGAVSGGIASVVTTPFDVGKTRRQVFRDSGDAATKSAKSATNIIRPEDRSMPRLLLHIFREEGMAGLFRGWVPRMAKVAPACAIMISSYEMGKKMARDARRKKMEEGVVGLVE